MERIDAVVAGAGVVGLAVARALALAGREVIVLEAAEAIGTGLSSRNSGVIHAGLYYPAGSLKARACVAGRRALYAYAAERGVAHRRTGKLIVATTPAELPALARIKAAAEANGVGDLAWLTGAEVRAREPELRAEAALWSPSTGIVDAHDLMLALVGDLEAAGGLVATRTPVERGRVTREGIVLETGGAEPMTLATRLFVNAAGLGAPALARAIAGQPRLEAPRQRLAKGSYFGLEGLRPPFATLVYPVPEPGGLGIHATLDLAGRVRFGPDVEWVEHADCRVDPGRAGHFAAAIRRYWPGLPDGSLVPDYAGLRPKLAGPGEPAADFRIDGPRTHGAAGVWHLFGIESPGLTSALALGRHLTTLIADTAAAA